MHLSVVICTYNPNTRILKKVLDSLKRQNLAYQHWELIVIDNNSTSPVSQIVDLSWHPAARIIVEQKPGLSYARVAGVKHAQAALIVFVDDDNVLDENYLVKSYEFHQAHPNVGCFGGRSLPIFDNQPPAWFHLTGINLGCQDFGDELYISNYAASGFHIQQYPEKAPIGTGMVILKAAFLSYKTEAATDPERMKLGRRGQSLSSGEDNDIILTLVKKGYEIAYVPSLVVHHLIPAERYNPEYLKKMAFESNRSWIKVMQIHGINPHPRIRPWTLLPRKVRSYFVHRAWRSPLSAIRWKSSCGAFEGLSEI